MLARRTLAEGFVVTINPDAMPRHGRPRARLSERRSTGAAPEPEQSPDFGLYRAIPS